MFRAMKMKWARKLMSSKYFVVLTDKESVIALDGVSPDNMNDHMALQSQAAAIREFRDKLDSLITMHDKAAKKFLNKPAKESKTNTTTNRTPKTKAVKKAANRD